LTDFFDTCVARCAVLRGRRELSRVSGGFGERETPLPIPNRAVKPLSADGTWLARARESRTPPVYLHRPSLRGRPVLVNHSCVLRFSRRPVAAQPERPSFVRSPPLGIPLPGNQPKPAAGARRPPALESRGPALVRLPGHGWRAASPASDPSVHPSRVSSGQVGRAMTASERKGHVRVRNDGGPPEGGPLSWLVHTGTGPGLPATGAVCCSAWRRDAPPTGGPRQRGEAGLRPGGDRPGTSDPQGRTQREPVRVDARLVGGVVRCALFRERGKGDDQAHGAP
jgi:hypothetical protein